MSSNSAKESSKDSGMERNKEEPVASTTTEKVQQVEGGGNDVENNAPNTDRPAPEPSTTPRVPFTAMSQVDSDMALARALQDQERAYFLLQMGHGVGGFNADRFYYEGDHIDIPGDDEEDEDEDEEEGDGNDEEGEAGEDEEVEEVEEGEEDLEEAGVDARAAIDDHIDGADFDSDEAFARALQDKEDRDTTARLMALAGIHDRDAEFETDSNDSQEGIWEDVDPDNMSYEELIALGEAVGTESKGLTPQSIAALQQFTFVSDSKDSTSDQEQCAVCRLEYEEGDKMVRLPCKHQYHSECIQQWLERNKVCPVCSAEVTPDSSSSETKS